LGSRRRVIQNKKYTEEKKADPPFSLTAHHLLFNAYFAVLLYQLGERIGFDWR